MSGTGATVSLDGNTYNVDSTKLATERNKFTTHLGTIAGTDSKVTVGGVEYGLDSSKTLDAATELETVFGSLLGGDTPIEPPVVMRAAGLYQTGTDTMIASWDNLVANGTITVEDGAVTSQDSSSVLVGDLVLPADGNVTSIGGYAFQDCSSLTEIIIPDSVTAIGNRAFYNCSSLNKVNYLGTIDQWAQIEFYSFDSNPTCCAKDLYINNELVTEVNLTTATKISCSAFYYCQSITSVIIPDGVTSIEAYAFSNCTSLNSVTIGNDVSTIYGCAFKNCSSLTSVIIPNSVTVINNDAFNGCRSLQEITIPFVGDTPGRTSSDKYQTPFGWLFGTSSYEGGVAVQQKYYKKSLTSTTTETYYIPASLKKVTITDGSQLLYGAFYGCSMLTSIVLPDSLTKIVQYAFYNCNNLTDVYYNGSEEQWNAISIQTAANAPLTNATIHYNYQG